MRPPYTCIYREIWDDEKFYSMSEVGRLVYFYVLTTPMGNGLGCFKAGIAAMEEESRLLPKRFKEGFKEGLKQELFEYDEQHRVILIPKYFERNPPANPNGIKALSKEYIKIPDCELKSKCFQIVGTWIERQKESFAEPFKELFAKPLAEPTCTRTRARSPSPSPSLSPSYSLSSNEDSITATAKRSRSNGKGVATWEAYKDAYKTRYGTEPVRNARTNSLCCQIVDRLGAEEAPLVAAYYLSSRNAYHVGRGHSLQALVGDCEKIRTEWATGRQITQAKAREEDRLEKARSGWQKIIDECEDDEPAVAEVVGRSES